jgi:hypothetical protein
MMRDMDTNDILNASAPAALPADDPRLTPEAIEHRRVNCLVERDEHGRLLSGSQLPNRGRKNSVMVQTLARQFTERAISRLGVIMDDPKAPPAAQAAAACTLLDRGWGKSPVQIDVQQRVRFDSFLRDVGLLLFFRRHALPLHRLCPEAFSVLNNAQ